MQECFKYKEITLENCIINEGRFNFICDGDLKNVIMSPKVEE